MQIVDVVNLSRPYFASVKSACELVVLLHEDLHLFAQIYCLLVLYSDGHVKQRNIVQFEVTHKVVELTRREFELIHCEYLAALHVVQVGPYAIQGQFVVSELGCHFFEPVDGAIAPSALMETQAPEGRNVAGSDERVVLLNHLLWILSAADENEMDVSSERIEGELV